MPLIHIYERDDNMTIITNGDTGEAIAKRINRIITDSDVDPTVSNDSSQGFFVGSKWLNTVTGIEFICQDDTIDAANWIRMVPEFATQSEAEAGTSTTKSMSPLRVAQAIKNWILNVSIGSLGTFLDSTITTGDTVETSLGKLQGQVNAKQKTIKFGTSAPSGGSNGDVYDQYF